MHRLPTSKMKIELPLRSVPPFQSRILVDTLRTLHIRVGDVVIGRLAVVAPAAQHELDVRIGPIGVVGRVGVVHRHEVGQHRGAQILVEVGGDAHQLGTFDQERRMAHIGDARLVGSKRGWPICRRLGLRRAARTLTQAWTAFGHFRLGAGRVGGGWTARKRQAPKDRRDRRLGIDSRVKKAGCGHGNAP